MTIKISANFSPVAAASVAGTDAGFGSPYLALQ